MLLHVVALQTGVHGEMFVEKRVGLGIRDLRTTGWLLTPEMRSLVDALQQLSRGREGDVANPQVFRLQTIRTSLNLPFNVRCERADAVQRHGATGSKGIGQPCRQVREDAHDGATLHDHSHRLLRPFASPPATVRIDRPDRSQRTSQPFAPHVAPILIAFHAPSQPLARRTNSGPHMTRVRTPHAFFVLMQSMSLLRALSPYYLPPKALQLDRTKNSDNDTTLMHASTSQQIAELFFPGLDEGTGAALFLHEFD